MPTDPLVPRQIESGLQSIVIGILGLTGQSTAPAAVRIDWPTEGQPGWKIDEDVVFIGAIEVDDPYNRVRDLHTPPNDSVFLIQQISYIRCWQANIVAYGPNSFDSVRRIKSALFTQAVHDQLASLNLYTILDLPSPVRAPEQFSGQWWERVDFTIQFYERAVEQPTVGMAQSVEVIVDTRNSPPPALDFFVPPSAAPVIARVPTADLSAAGGSVTQDGAVLNAISEIVGIDILSPVTGLLGLLSIATAQLASGDFQSGGTFVDGSSIIIATPGYSTTYAGSIFSSTWALSTSVGGTHQYIMSGSFSSAQGSGTFILTTADIGDGYWAGDAAIVSASIHYN